MIELFANNAQTTLAGAISNTSLTVTLSPGSGALFPNPSSGQFFRMTFIPASTGIPGEIVYCTARSGDVCTIQRGQESTVATAYSAGDTAANLPTAGSTTNLTQQQQIQQNLYNYAVDTGTTNSYVVTLNPTSLATPVSGAPICFKAANTNTGASTLTVNSGTSYPIYGKANAALQGGEIVANGFYTVTWNSTSSVYVLTEGAGALQVGAATASQQALQLGQATGRLLNVQVFTSSGTYTPYSSLVTSVIVEAVGAGGGSGGVTAQTGGSNACSASGGGGAYARVRLTSGFSGATVTVGAAGTGGASGANAGGAGGTTSFGSIVSCPGGLGGLGVSGGTTASVSLGAGASSYPTISSGTTLVTMAGSSGGAGFAFASNAGVCGGTGGSSPLGNGGQGTGGSGSQGNPGTGHGAGAGSSTAPSGAGGFAGSAGSSGLIIVYEYA